MTIQEILLSGGSGVVMLLTLLQIAPIKINPWSKIAKAIGRAINAEVLEEQKAIRARLEAHIQAADERNADMWRANILRFNSELIRRLPHTKEDFNNIFLDIDDYETYCRDNPAYKNSRAVHAIANIGRVYDERLKKHDFAE